MSLFNTKDAAEKEADQLAKPVASENQKVRALDADLEVAEEVGMVVSNAETGNVSATVADDASRQKAELLASRHSYDVEFRTPEGEVPKAMFTPRELF